MAKRAKAHIAVSGGTSVIADLAGGVPSYWEAEAGAIAAEVAAELAAEEAAYADLARMLLDILNRHHADLSDSETIDAASAALGVDVREMDLS
jgi:hypothetical protein